MIVDRSIGYETLLCSNPEIRDQESFYDFILCKPVPLQVDLMTASRTWKTVGFVEYHTRRSIISTSPTMLVIGFGRSSLQSTGWGEAAISRVPFVGDKGLPGCVRARRTEDHWKAGPNGRTERFRMVSPCMVLAFSRRSTSGLPGAEPLQLRHAAPASSTACSCRKRS